MNRIGNGPKSFFLWTRKHWKDLLITWAGLAIVVLTVLYVHVWAPASRERRVKIIIIQPGSNFQEVSRVLEEEGIVRQRRSFYLLARLRNAIPGVKAGEYELHTNMTPGEVLAKLIRGEVIKYPITIPEGFNLFQIGEVLGKAGICSPQGFMERTKDPLLIGSLGLEEDSLEGFLFPDTYRFPRGYGEEAVIRQMVSRFHTIYLPLAKRAEEMGLSRREVVILASMIEKEAMDDRERRMISAVFHNRLRRGMALQSDPTAVYGIKREDRSGSRITRQDLKRKTPYNTYQVVGLPKGPIANPGLKSLEAVLDPAEVDYLYFVSKNDGTHHFSRTLEEHNRAVDRYQRSRIRPSKPESPREERDSQTAPAASKIPG